MAKKPPPFTSAPTESNTTDPTDMVLGSEPITGPDCLIERVISAPLAKE